MGILCLPGSGRYGTLVMPLAIPLSRTVSTSAQAIEDDLFTLLGKVLSVEESRSLLDLLQQQVSWQNTFMAFGRKFDVPRLQAWYADAGIHYRYSDNMLHSHDWIKPLLSLKQDIEKLTGHSFNSVLVTHYRDGNDHVSWHADDEAELGKQPVIASLSLGCSREFQYRHKYKNERGSMTLHDGELLVMHPVFQHNWEHCVPVEENVVSPRMNLTFRNVMMKEA